MNQSHFGEIWICNVESNNGYWDVFKFTNQIVICPHMFTIQPTQKTVKSLVRHLSVQNQAYYLSSLPYMHIINTRGALQLRETKCSERFLAILVTWLPMVSWPLYECLLWMSQASSAEVENSKRGIYYIGYIGYIGYILYRTSCRMADGMAPFFIKCICTIIGKSAHTWRWLSSPHTHAQLISIFWKG